MSWGVKVTRENQGKFWENSFSPNSLQILPSLPSLLRVSLYPDNELRLTFASRLIVSASIDAVKASKTTEVLW